MSRICSVFANVNLNRYVLITRNNYNNGQRYTENAHAGTRRQRSDERYECIRDGLHVERSSGIQEL